MWKWLFKSSLKNISIQESLKTLTLDPSKLTAIAPQNKILMTVDHVRRFIYYAEFKRILDAIEFNLKTQDVHCLSLLSFKAEEGKTFFASSLALGFAELLGKRVLLVDASNPISHWGLEDVFLIEDRLDPAKSEGIVTSLAIGVDYIKLASFRPVTYKAQEYRVQDVIAEYKNKYDLIIFDSSALQTSNRGNFDPWVIASRTDASILICSKKSMDSAQLSPNDPLFRLKFIGVIENQGA